MLTGLQHFKRLALAPGATGRRRTKRSDAPLDLLVRKDLFVAPVALENDRQLRFTLSTAAVDRAMDTIDQSGWDLSAYRRNPVVLWAHGFDMAIGSLPIGRCVDIAVVEGALTGVVEFDPEDDPISGPWSETLLRKCKRGTLSATSVGFRPLDFEVTEDPARGADDWFPGFDFKRQELTEFSIVAVPCNQEALINPEHRVDPANPASGLLDPVVSAACEGNSKRPSRLRNRLALG
jgi:HK97 family phage prohead protease